MKSKIWLLCILFLSHLCQVAGQEVIATSGGYFENENLSLSFTVGEPVIETFTAANVTLTQGFQQPWSFYLQQIINVPVGWSGISSYVDPRNKGVEGIFSPWESDLIILASMTGMYWPASGTNTLGNWEYNTGYQIKAANAFDLLMTGTKVSDPTVEIPAGWCLLPVLVACETPAEELFAGFEDLTIVKQVAGVNLYWPAYNINTLGNLIPGKAYFVAASDAGQVTFPACTKSRYSPPPQVKLVNITPWNDFSPTAASHAVAFPVAALTTSGITPGDVIGVFTPDGICTGQVEVNQVDRGLALVAFGNDEISIEKEGFEYGETLQFKIYRPATGEEMLLEVEFDPALPNMGNYSAHGLSAVKTLKLQAAHISENSAINFEVYPNPSHGHFEIRLSIWPKKSQIQLMDTRGGLVEVFELGESSNNKSKTFDFTHLQKGIYFLKVSGEAFSSVKKIVIN